MTSKAEELWGSSEAGNGTARLVVVGIDEALVVLTASPDLALPFPYPSLQQ